MIETFWNYESLFKYMSSIKKSAYYPVNSNKTLNYNLRLELLKTDGLVKRRGDYFR